MIEPGASACQSFNDDGFVVVEQLIKNNQIGRLHRAFSDLFNGEFETGVRPDEVNWQQADGDPSLTRQICNGWKANNSEHPRRALVFFQGDIDVSAIISSMITTSRFCGAKMAIAPRRSKPTSSRHSDDPRYR
jgi:hypothetical protein